MTDKERIKELEDLVEHYANAQVWYTHALEALTPFRYHVADVLENSYQVEDNDNTLVLAISKKRLDELKKVALEAENFFVTRKADSEVDDD